MSYDYVPYVSYSSYGVDATDFYWEFGVNITEVSRNTGVTRKSVSRVPIKHASEENTKKIILYLEEVSINDYGSAVQQCKKEIIMALKELEAAWQNYEKREGILEMYRCRYQIERGNEPAKKETLWNILRCVKDL